MKIALSAGIIGFSFFLFSGQAFAAPLGDANVDVTIDKDTATILWTMPCSTDSNKAIASGSLTEIGYTKYDVTYVSATANGMGAYVAQSQGGSDQDVTIYCGKGGTTATYTYTIKSKVTGGGITVEIPVYYNTYTFDSANVRVHVPSNLLFLSASEPYKNENQTLVFRFQKPREADYIQGSSLLMVFGKNPLPNGYEHKKIGPYDIYALSRSMRLIEKMEPYIGELQPFYKKTLGLDLSEHSITILVSDLKKIATEYEAGGIAIPKNKLIVLDADNLAYSQTVDVVKILVHETAHILMGNSGAFSNEETSIPWMDEGIAVFNEEYFADQFFDKEDEVARQKSDSLTGYVKLSTSTLAKEYDHQFDTFFTRVDDISNSYSHAGLVFYKAYLDDPKILIGFVKELRQINVDHYCESCTSRRAQILLETLGNRTEDETFYPFKNGIIDPKYNILFKSIADEASLKKIKGEFVGSATQYFSSTTKNTVQKPVVLAATTSAQKNPVESKKAPEEPKAATSTMPEIVSTTTEMLPPGTTTEQMVEKNTEPVATPEPSVIEKIFFAPARVIHFFIDLISGIKAGSK
jgi:hypothetical protein